MEKQYSVQFFTSFVENLQRLCQNYITYDQMVEVSGYISVEIDNSKKERYVLSELVQSTGNVISESYCTKVFKNCPLPVQRSPGQRREPPVMSQVSPAAKRPLSQTSPNINRMGRSPQMNRQMSPSGVMRPNNDNSQRPSSFSQRPSSFSQRLNQVSSYSAGRGTPPRMSSSFPGSGPGRGTMPPSQRFGQQGGNPVGRPGMGSNPRMMNPSQRMNQGGPTRQPGQMSSVQRMNSDPSQRMGQQGMGPNSIQARRSFGPGQRQSGQPQSKSPVDDPDELEVISFVPPPRRSVGEASTSSLSSGTRSPLTPETTSSTSNRPQFPTSVNRSGSNTSSIQHNSQGQNSSQSIALPVSLVQNVAQPTAPQMSRNQSQPMNQQMSQSQDFTRTSMQQSSQAQSHSMPQVSQASDSRQQLGHQGYQNQNQNMPQTSQPSEPTSQAQPTRQQLVQQMLQARANRNLQIPPSLQQHAPTPVSQQSTMQQQGSHPMSSQPMSQSMSQKPPPMPQQVYQNQNFSQNQLSMQPPHTPPGQIMSNPLQDPTRNIWDEMTQPSNFPQGADKKDPGILGSLNLPGLESSVDSTGPLEISARNTSFMDTVGDKKSLAVSSSAPPASVASSSHLSFPDDPLGSLQISNVVSLPTDTLPDINCDTVNTSQAPASFGDLNPSSTPSIIAEAFASLESVTLQDDAASMTPVTSEANSSVTMDNALEEDMPSKKPRLSTETTEQAGGPTSTNSSKLMVPIGRKIKEFAAKKRAKRGRPRQDKPTSKLEKGESEDEEAPEFETDVTVDPPNRTLRSRGRNPLRRIYNESSDSECSLPEAFGLNFESTVSTSAGLVLAGEGEASEDGGKDSGGGGSDTAPAPPDLYSGSEKMAHSTGSADSRKSPDVLSEADNESYVIIELESDDEFDESGSADSSTPVIKQELSTFTKPVQFAINRLTQFMILKKVKEPAYSIVPETLDPLLAEFYLRLRKSDGEEFIASSLKQIQNCIGTYLSTNGYPFCIKSDPKFEKSRKTMENKLKHLKSREDAIFTVRPEDVDKLYEIGQLGTGSAESLVNTMWLMNTIHFSIRRPREHINLKWGDVKIGRENHQEYIEHLPSGKIVWKNLDNPKRCFVTLYKKYRQMRPASAQGAGSSFYLASSEKADCLKHQKYGDQKMANIFKRMLSAASLPQGMKISNLDIL